eukprot:CAMPEP_0179437318 /NCGR_PEP_ID=MMETSP0799-20121207/21234_1 /TAXON_ID=46947 /ORGANISM="Geminigera cryophila, Strain CCMP2564" /LENGTH=206 /DNA_ID=CAMNT_0021218181 /DNA_START=33 /DNA_END=654 /DNA_ORIENTATION=-
MGRLPGGIVDETRDYIIKEVDEVNRSRLLKFSSSQMQKSTQSTGATVMETLPGITGRSSMDSMGMRSRTQSPRMRGLFTANTVRGMRYPLRRVIKTAPRNVVTNAIKEGISRALPTKGIAGEFAYSIEGPDSPRALPLAFDPPFMYSSPTKKLHGSGTYDGMFAKPTYMELGPPQRWPTFEQTGKRMLAQSLYPVQVFPTSMLQAN